ncbi:hypothetical protein [Actinoplanes sp. NPDC049802]|uniref:hypothetical protein n=1 Tax=Actinoplanes sp. NPDC049802 TaxID=3154742 RepID=UPI0033C7A892
MSNRLDVVTGEVRPERRLILVLGGSGGGTLAPDFSRRRLCYAGPDELYLISSNERSHPAIVSLEAWDGEPSSSPDADATDVTEMELRDGTAVLTFLGERVCSPVLTVGPPGRYGVRVEVTDGDPERLRVGFWPLDEVASIDRHR